MSEIRARRKLNDDYYNLIKKTLDRIVETHPENAHQKVYALFKKLFYIITEDEKIEFSSLFSRISYASSGFNIRGKLLMLTHIYRISLESHTTNLTKEEQYEFGVYLIDQLLNVLWKNKPFQPPVDTHNFYRKIEPQLIKSYSEFIPNLKAVILDLDKVLSTEEIIALTVTIEDNIGSVRKVFLPVEQVDTNNIKLINHLLKNDLFPTTVMLLDISIDEQNHMFPKAILWQPDYMIDVTGISECYNGRATEPIKYLLHKLLPTKPNPYLLSGNIINYFLDQLLYNENKTYKELEREVFNLYPLDFTLLSDKEVRVVLERIKTGFTVLKNTISKEFAAQNITKERAILEPTFISPKYGIHGRLDLFQAIPEEGKADIVELKSGSPFMPNTYGLSINHYIQTLLYDLLISNSHPELKKKRNYILYARDYDSPLKFAPAVRSQQIEALMLRNNLMIIENHLTELDDSPKYSILDRINVKNQSGLTGFAREDVLNFQNAWKNLNRTEKSYVKGLIGMLSREQHLSKIGTEGLNGKRGMASLWLQRIKSKEENYAILRHIKVEKDESHQKEPIVRFKKSQVTNQLANFRVGDIVILYKESAISPDGIKDQVYKSTILEIDSESVTIRLRAQQCGKSAFIKNSYWNIEPDVLDSSFLAQFQNIFTWMKSSEDRRVVTLGACPPKKNKDENIELSEVIQNRLTQNQLRALKKMIVSEDYFLLWGPPGTGKTSMMLRSYVEHLYGNTEESILLLAYTNRAVDEICEAILDIPDIDEDKVIRIGSRYGVDERFKGLLLQNKIKGAVSRDAIRTKLNSFRLYVSTVASFSHKQGISSIMDFDRVIIDESSQLLDPMILPILARYPKVTMIGDHKQLPAIVAQNEHKTKVQNENLLELGFENFRISLFERLFKRAQDKGWDWAYDILYEQGRMHRDIMEFVSSQFYENELEGVKFKKSLYAKEFAFNWLDKNQLSERIKEISSKRILYIPTAKNELEVGAKYNKDEAQTIVEIIKSYHKYTDIDLKNIGIITPYRAQISHLRNLFDIENSEYNKLINIDTVERYQGSAKDIIILSLCANTLYQLESNKNEYDVLDRKFNVALTRAREQLIILGCSEIMNQVHDYKNFIHYVESQTP